MNLFINHKHHKLILGSAQFGLDYGISNKKGKTPFPEVKEILVQAKAAGISTIDTASAYGDSESIIGRALDELQFPLNIITKFATGKKSNIREAFNESLRKLKVKKIHGYLLHNFSIYQDNPDILKELQDLKTEGRVDKIGVSIYHPHEAEKLIDKQESIDILQFPYNAFDQRFDPLLPKLTELNIESHIRSVYLQGLFFLKTDQLPANLTKAAEKIEFLQKLALEVKLHPGALLLGFALANPNISKVIIGVESLANLNENINFSGTVLSEETLCRLHNLVESDESIILPYNW